MAWRRWHSVISLPILVFRDLSSSPWTPVAGVTGSVPRPASTMVGPQRSELPQPERVPAPWPHLSLYRFKVMSMSHVN